MIKNMYSIACITSLYQDASLMISLMIIMNEFGQIAV